MNPIIQISINEVDSPFFKLGETYTVILYFQDKDKNFLRDSRLPQGHRQKVKIESLPFELSFSFTESDFILEDTYIVVLIEKDGILIYGELPTTLTVTKECLKISSVEVICKNGKLSN